MGRRRHAIGNEPASGAVAGENTKPLVSAIDRNAEGRRLGSGRIAVIVTVIADTVVTIPA
jgi:hypothetical protein